MLLATLCGAPGALGPCTTGSGASRFYQVLEERLCGVGQANVQWSMVALRF